MERYKRTDLACETPKDARGGASVREYRRAGIRIEEMTVRAGADEAATGRAAGKYVTLHCGKIWLLDRRETARASHAAAEVLRTFLAEALGRPPGKGDGVLVAGLGNRFITADSIGPRTADQVTVTNHAVREDSLLGALGCCRVSALCPGVLGQTGVEAAALVADAVRAAGADVLIAVDALAARSTARLATTVQISDTGIRPGSGIGNCRTPLTRREMGVPVIALGVPTVVDSSTLVWDALSRAGIREVGDELRAVLEDERSYIVSPRESDLIASSVAGLLAGALNRALTPALL